jgi:phosphoadenosine phosphosulfate reductase
MLLSHGDSHVRTRGQSAAEALDAQLAAQRTLKRRLARILNAAPQRLAFSTSLGLEDQAILHAIAETGPGKVDVFTLDTGRHFPETLETIDESERRYGLRIRLISPNAAEVEDLVARDGAFGFRQSIDARKACCEVRKVGPLRRCLAGAGTWITGLRRGQFSRRSNVPFAEWSAEYGLVKVNPLADWSLEQLKAYIAANDIPVNPLHARGFPSIGCQPCTRAIQPGEDIRAGRWWWEQADGKECGLHSNPHRPSKEAAA